MTTAEHKSDPPHLVFGPLERCVHLCVDMQRLFAEGTEWSTPWMKRVLPNVLRLVRQDPARTVFTRFIPPRSPEECEGAWRRYWTRWSSLTLQRLPREAVDLMPELAQFVPPAHVVDKRVHSPWLHPSLEQHLRRLEADTLVVTGGETEVCVLGTVLGAIDRGYRVVVAADGLCSSSDKTHDELLDVCTSRYGQNVEVANADEILRCWRS